MTPGQIFTVVRDAYYRRCPKGDFGYGYPVDRSGYSWSMLSAAAHSTDESDNWFVRVPPGRGMLSAEKVFVDIDIIFEDGQAIISKNRNGYPYQIDGKDRVICEYSDPKFLKKVLDIIFWKTT